MNTGIAWESAIARNSCPDPSLELFYGFSSPVAGNMGLHIGCQNVTVLCLDCWFLDHDIETLLDIKALPHDSFSLLSTLSLNSSICDWCVTMLDSFPEFLFLPRRPAYSLLHDYWLFSSLLNQSEAVLVGQRTETHIHSEWSDIPQQSDICSK